MAAIDFAFLIAYFTRVAAIGYWSSRHSRDDSRAYFLGDGGVGWWAIGASLFASNISTEHFIGLAGTGAETGLAVGQFEWTACICLMLLGWLFVPFCLRTDAAEPWSLRRGCGVQTADRLSRQPGEHRGYDPSAGHRAWSLDVVQPTGVLTYLTLRARRKASCNESD